MTYTQHYDSPLGGILMAADEIGLTGLWFDGQKYFARNLPAEHTEQKTPALAEAGCLLYRKSTGISPAAASHRLCISPVGVGNPFADSLWADHDLRRNRTAACRKAGPFQAVRAGGRRRGGTQRNIDHNSLPPCGRYERQSDRVCRRDRQKTASAGIGAYGYDRLFRSEERDGAVTGPKKSHAVTSREKNTALPVFEATAFYSAAGASNSAQDMEHAKACSMSCAIKNRSITLSFPPKLLSGRFFDSL